MEMQLKQALLKYLSTVNSQLFVCALFGLQIMHSLFFINVDTFELGFWHLSVSVLVEGWGGLFQRL
jgi:hypothetical protein